MSPIIEISNPTTLHAILSWLCDHVGQVTSQHVFVTQGHGWRLHHAGGVTVKHRIVSTRNHRIMFEDHVDPDVITQFALTFS